MESDLPERYNTGLVPPPELAGAPARLRYPTWQPTPTQVQAARKQVGGSLAGLVVLSCACCLIFALLLGWKP